jgi:hypothetical protein
MDTQEIFQLRRLRKGREFIETPSQSTFGDYRKRERSRSQERLEELQCILQLKSDSSFFSFVGAKELDLIIEFDGSRGEKGEIQVHITQYSGESLRVRIRDLKPHMENITIVARVLNKTQVVEIRGKKYSSATVEDKTGKIMLNLWRDQVSQIEEGDLIKIQNAFVHVRMGVTQLSTWADIEKAGLEDLDF